MVTLLLLFCAVAGVMAIATGINRNDTLITVAGALVLGVSLFEMVG